MKKVLYIHGYNGSPYGETYDILKNELSDCEVVSLEIDFNAPEEALKKYFDSGVYDYIVASSFGAFFAGMVQGNGVKILINPALPNDVYKLDPDYDCTKANELMKKNYSYRDGELSEETYFIFGDKDEVASNHEFFKNLFYEKNMYSFDMGHKLTKECAKFIHDEFIR